MEIQRVKEQLSFEFGISAWEPVHPDELLPMLQEDIDVFQDRTADLRHYLETTADPQRFKAWLKTLSLRRRRSLPTDFEMPF
jgi:hypothetical protein